MQKEGDWGGGDMLPLCCFRPLCMWRNFWNYIIYHTANAHSHTHPVNQTHTQTLLIDGWDGEILYRSLKRNTVILYLEMWYFVSPLSGFPPFCRDGTGAIGHQKQQELSVYDMLYWTSADRSNRKASQTHTRDHIVPPKTTPCHHRNMFPWWQLKFVIMTLHQQVRVNYCHPCSTPLPHTHIHELPSVVFSFYVSDSLCLKKHRYSRCWI